jgi:hypothetical protein
MLIMKKVYRYLFYLSYKRWYKKDRDVGLATFRTLAELSIYTAINIVAIVLNSALWLGTAMPGTKATRSELYIGVIPFMIVSYLAHYYFLVRDGRRQKILDEFRDMPKRELTPLKLYLALYFLVTFVLLVGLPWLYNSLYDHLK